MVEITNIKQIVAISQSLSNEKRVRLISLLKDGTPKTLREIYEASRDHIDLEHRETLYKYIESLTSAKLLNKEESEEGITYKLAYGTITFDFLTMG